MRRIRSLYPLTLRGTLLLSGSLYLLIGPGMAEADLVASTVGAASLTLLTLLLAINITTWWLIRNSLKLSLFAPQPPLYANTPLRFILRTSALRLTPLFRLELSGTWEHSGVTFPANELFGFALAPRTLPLTLTFPHRGIWELLRVTAKLTDRFALTLTHMQFSDSAASFNVYPQATAQRYVPIVSSMERSGDTLSSQDLRSGDLFDLKPYHPADGMRRVVWKLFAKSGALISRHPEPAMTPEGTVVVFAYARKEDDAVCSNVYQYLKTLEDSGLNVLFASETGLEQSEPINSSERAIEDLIDSVWNSPAVNYATPLVNLIEVAQKLNPSARIRSVVVFLSLERIQSAKEMNELSRALTSLSSQNVKPVIIAISKDGARALSQATLSDSRLKQSFRRFMFNSDNRAEASKIYAAQFLESCAKSNWEVLL